MIDQKIIDKIINCRIDLYSDTHSRPSDEMRNIIASAEVGDEQQFLDPNVNFLCKKISKLLGKESAVFLPSGTMCNQIAFKVHCNPGDEIILDQGAHPINSEAGGPSAISMAQTRSIATKRGIFSPEQVIKSIRPNERYSPVSRVLSVENTTGFGGGAVWPISSIKDVCDVAHNAGILTHMDGARLMNAVVESGTSAKEYASYFDSIWIDLSKGLGCPFGAVLLGNSDFIENAWKYKQMMGGAMRQAGMLAAAGIFALDNNINRLRDDHENAREFANSIASIPGIKLTFNTCETNIVFFDVSETKYTAHVLSERLLDRGLYIGALDEFTMRAVTYLNINRDLIIEAVEILREEVNL